MEGPPRRRELGLDGRLVLNIIWLVHPHAVLLDELHERVAGLLVRDRLLHDFLPDVQVDLAGRAPHVPKVGVGHLARAVDDAAHDRDGHAR